MKVLVIGLGSIGTRHANNFISMGHEVATVSRREQKVWKNFSTIQEAMSGFDADFAIVANETSRHHEALEELLKISSRVRVLVEKPLFADFSQHRFWSNSARVSVAYNLRFHPLVEELVKNLGSQKIISWNAYIGQNLKSWRSGRSYQESYSASKGLGGGVLRDLSHEIDMFSYVTGAPELVSAYGGKYSNLMIDSDDHYTLILKSPNCAHATIHMNCLDHLTQRRMTVNTNNNTYEIDLIAATIKDKEGLRAREIPKNQSYLDMSRAFIYGDQRLCSYAQGLHICDLINKAEAMQ